MNRSINYHSLGLWRRASTAGISNHPRAPSKDVGPKSNILSRPNCAFLRLLIEARAVRRVDGHLASPRAESDEWSQASELLSLVLRSAIRSAARMSSAFHKETNL